MKRFIDIILFSVILGNTACVEDVLVQVEPAEERMVVSSLFIPDSIIIVTVTRSFSALSANSLEVLENDLISTLLVDRALVSITSNGKTDTLFRLSPGVFIGILDQPKALDLFELNIYDSLTKSSIRSFTQLKPQVKFDSVSVNLSINDADTSSIAYYQFLDPAVEDNWYLVQGFELPRLPNLDNINFDIENGEVVLTPDTSNQIFFTPEINVLFTHLISDLTLANDTVASTVNLPFVPKDTTIFVVFNIDEGYYDFLQARKRSGGILNSLTREPVNHPTNVENGYGYFTMHLPYFRAFIRKED
ncbi:MAG: hypothetical protein ACJA08_002562 [Cyclobacteriaceae bacterium]|jgi:hypothetical protein